MANETLSAQIAGIVIDIEADVQYILNHQNPILDLVRTKDTQGIPGKTVDFPAYGAIASSDVNSTAEGTDVTSNKQVTNTETEATVAEHVIMATVSDLAVMSTRNQLVDDIVLLFTDGIRAKLEDDIMNLLTAFTQTVAGAATTITSDHWMDAIRQIAAAKGNLNELVAFLSPKQVWGAKGIQNFLVTPALDSGGVGETFKNVGWVGNYAGVDIYWSNEINEDIGSGGDAAGGMFSKRAIGLNWKGVTIGVERNESLRGFEIVATGRWGEIELVDTWGVYMLSDVA